MQGIDVSSHLDKMNISFRHCEQLADMLPCDSELLKPEEEIRPFPHYHRAYRLKCGGIANLSNSDRQGARLDLGGDAFSAFRASGMSDLDWMRTAASFPRKRWTTRIDYCFNIHGGEITFVEDTLREWDERTCKSKFRNEPEVFDNRRGDKGMTIYYGSRKGDKLVRVYDKAAEMNLLKEAWTRVELKLNKPHSAAFVVDALDHDLPIVGRSWLLQLIDFPTLDWWNFMVCGDTIEPRDARKHQDKFWLWAKRDVIRWIAFRAKNGQQQQADEFYRELGLTLYEVEDCLENEV